MTLEGVLVDRPALHRNEAGALVSWGLAPDVLRFIAGAIGQHARTLETGAGLSTIAFALARAEHICIVPDAGEVGRIKEYCRAQDISLDRVTFHVGRSEAVLPTLILKDLDLVLIDGRHGFPAPFVDWYYTAIGLKRGGLMVVDDTQLWTARTLAAFLLEEPEWQLERRFSRTIAFRKLRDGGHLKEWTGQPFVARQSGEPMEQS